MKTNKKGIPEEVKKRVVGAQESKQVLVDHAALCEVPCITLLGRRGGSALAAATLNALGRLARGLRF
jgi:Precorrin isomerase